MNYVKIAKKAVADCLVGNVARSLYSVSCVADRAARAAGKKKDLFPSLYDYQDILPSGYTTAWLKNASRPNGDSMLYAVPKNFEQVESESILLGQGLLIPTYSPDD